MKSQSKPLRQSHSDDNYEDDNDEDGDADEYYSDEIDDGNDGYETLDEEEVDETDNDEESYDNEDDMDTDVDDSDENDVEDSYDDEPIEIEEIKMATRRRFIETPYSIRSSVPSSSKPRKQKQSRVSSKSESNRNGRQSKRLPSTWTSLLQPTSAAVVNAIKSVDVSSKLVDFSKKSQSIYQDVFRRAKVCF